LATSQARERAAHWLERLGIAALDDAGAALDAHFLIDLIFIRQNRDPESMPLCGSLEVRLDDTRHLSSWAGGQEALHDRVLTLDEAVANIGAVAAADVQRLAGELFRSDALRLAVVAPPGAARDVERALTIP